VSKRHQSSRRKAYGRRQHELRERADRNHLPESLDLDGGRPGTSSAIDPLVYLDPRTPRLHFAIGD
jgi:hypothetical protein